MSDGLSLPAPTWFVGCGNMGGAIIDGWRGAGVDLGAVTVIRPSGKEIDDVRTVRSLAEAGAPPSLAVLAFKPQMLDEIAPELRKFLSAKTTVISLLAGVEAASLRRRFPGVGAIVRATPNLGVQVRRGVVGLYGEGVDPRLEAQISELFGAIGFAMWMADEERLAALGSVAGAGPAYVARFIDALAKAAQGRGLSKEIADTIALETVLGTAWMAAANRESMASVASRVASPKGTTEAGLAVLDHDGVLDELVTLTIEAASRRGKELAEEARAQPS